MKIEEYSFGRIVIDGQTYTSDVIIHPGRVDDKWWRKEGHNLADADLDSVWPEAPEILVVGTGSPGLMKVDPSVEQRCKRERIELIALPTAEAVAAFNRLSAENKKAAAALHLTC
jgi:hypothetical protein